MNAVPLIVFSLLTPVTDRGQFGDVPQSVRDWFASQPIAACCALADGQPTDFEMRADGYYVPVPWSTELVRVPNDKLILNRGNPIGRAIIWYNEETKYIRCFVPGGGV